LAELAEQRPNRNAFAEMRNCLALLLRFRKVEEDLAGVPMVRKLSKVVTDNDPVRTKDPEDVLELSAPGNHVDSVVRITRGESRTPSSLLASMHGGLVIICSNASGVGCISFVLEENIARLGFSARGA